MNVGKNIAVLRKSANLTQEQLAEKCGVSRQAVTKWEIGESEPSIERLVMLSQVFQVSIDEIVTGNKTEIFGNVCTGNKEIKYRDIEMCIAELSIYDFPSQDLYEAHVLLTLPLLLEFLKYKYTDSKGNVLEKYFVKNTTCEERAKYVELINKFEAIQNYVDGKCEIIEALDEACDAVYNKCDQINQAIEKRLSNKVKLKKFKF